MKIDHELETRKSRALVETITGLTPQRDGDNPDKYQYFDKGMQILEPGFLPYGGRYVGVDGYKALHIQIDRYLDVTTAKVESMVVDGNVVVTFHRIKTRNRDSELQLAKQWTISNGKVVAMKLYIYDLGSLPRNATLT